MKILLASKNRGKVRELQELLAEEDIEVLSLLDLPAWEEVEETGDTFAANALLKARAAVARTGLISLADDSGLEVDALNGAPGVKSARFAGEPADDARNNEKLLRLLAEVPDAERTGRFRCTLALVTPQGEEFLTEGALEGRIMRHGRGSKGFGYDPLFFIPEIGRTMAELSTTQKNKLSHRAQAFRQAVPILKELRRRLEKGEERLSI